MPTTKIDYRGADLYPAQRAAIFDPARISIVEASTKAGKTIGCLSWLFEQAADKGKPGREFWWIAPVYGQAEIGYRRMKLRLPKSIYKPNESKLTLTLINGARIAFKSGEKPDGLYGEDVWAAVMDEASRMREEAWYAVRSTLTATRGPVRIIGNVRGRKNWFFRLARAAEAGDPDMAYHRLTAHDAAAAGVLDADEVAAARRDFERLGKLDVFEELYMAKASEDGANPFGIKAIRNCIAPLSTNPLAVGGVDLAGRGAHNVNESGERDDRDYTAIVALDRDGAACHIERFRLPHAETMGALQRILARTPTLMDSTGSGDPIVEWCQRQGRMMVEGYTFTPRSKQDLMERLALAIQTEEIHFPEGELVSELESFEFEYTRNGVRYSAPAGLHDDLVCALALAVMKRPYRSSITDLPMGIPGQSKWQGAGDNDAWRKYQDTLKPTQRGRATDGEVTAPVNVPALIIGNGAGKWR